jgi:tRNA A37 methylthiotransferase MiaB
MPDQVTEKIKNQRSAVIRKLSEENKLVYFSKMIGKRQRMLIERITSDGTARGYGENYIPIRLKAKELVRNQFVEVELTGIHHGKETEMTAKLLVNE